MVGMIGPDGLGTCSLLGLMAGFRIIQRGEVIVLGRNPADCPYRPSPIAIPAYFGAQQPHRNA
jgi:ABC-type thiamine transport system ATPase subunit